ncbi:unnamed protein product [Bursaphelenchus okinawaensis]|uniref:Legumain n=1 Tax=Bursaphelenchus okinawaensis TaxID=465554 RepID=A0A811LTI0_9BILA|nr:unnamed protein product [Bursaphelenchus okinawaensis]CAG9128299.1 unnamed protein product [Bursaphelenchus okinawaensis]
MKLVSVIVLLVGIVHSNVLRNFLKQNDEDGGEVYAVLVAGNGELHNMFSEADVCLLYHILVHHGVKEEKIITFLEDDIKDDPDNPWHGELRLGVDGPDVRKGCKVSYSGANHNVDNFLKVLKGDDTGVGPVLNSTEKDRVFLYHASHGGQGFVAFGDYVLFTNQVKEAFDHMHSQRKYKELLYHVDACFSGSMVSWLPEDWRILGFTGANESEFEMGSSFKVGDIRLDLVGEMSCAWQHSVEREDLDALTIKEQYNYVKNKTHQSTVSVYGDKSILKEPVGLYDGETPYKFGKPVPEQTCALENSYLRAESDLHLLKHKLEMAKVNKNYKKAKEVAEELQKLHDLRENVNQKIDNLVLKTISSRGFIVNELAEKHQHLDCYEQVTRAFFQHCHPEHKKKIGRIKYDKIQKLCHGNLPAEVLVENLQAHCQN